MAGDWIPIRTQLHAEPEVLLIAEKTGRPVNEVTGLLVMFWGWASEVSEDGKIPCASCSQPVRILCAQVGADENFWSAVVDVGWLSLDGGIVIPRFNNWLSKSAKRRLKERRRMRLKRAKEGPKFVRKTSARNANGMRTTGQDRTGEMMNPPSPLKGGARRRRSMGEIRLEQVKEAKRQKEELEADGMDRG